MNFIPTQYQTEWNRFYKEHENIDLYEAWEGVVLNEWKREKLGWLQHPDDI